MGDNLHDIKMPSQQFPQGRMSMFAGTPCHTRVMLQRCAPACSVCAQLPATLAEDQEVDEKEDLDLRCARSDCVAHHQVVSSSLHRAYKVSHTTNVISHILWPLCIHFPPIYRSAGLVYDGTQGLCACSLRKS